MNAATAIARGHIEWEDLAKAIHRLPSPISFDEILPKNIHIMKHTKVPVKKVEDESEDAYVIEAIFQFDISRYRRVNLQSGDDVIVSLWRTSPIDVKVIIRGMDHDAIYQEEEVIDET